MKMKKDLLIILGLIILIGIGIYYSNTQISAAKLCNERGGVYIKQVNDYVCVTELKILKENEGK